jgi:hypothetical protein
MTYVLAFVTGYAVTLTVVYCVDLNRSWLE